MSAAQLSIVHVSTERGWRGGEQQVRLLTDGLAARGHRCLVLSPPGAALNRNRAEAGMAADLPYRFEFDLAAAHRIAAEARRAGADVIHAHTSHAHSLAWMSSLFGAPPVVVSRRVDFPVGGNWLSRRKYFSPRVRFIAISDAVAGVLRAAGVPGERIAIVHSGVDPSRFAFRSGPRDAAAAEQRGAPEGIFLVVNVAALTDHKDQATLLRATAVLRKELPNIRLVVAGSGELEQPLRALCSPLRVDETGHFGGHVTDLATLYRAADLFVMSSHLEGLCTSILDAMLAGVPVVAMRTGGIPEIVRDGVNGLLATPRSPETLAAAMKKLLSEPALAAQYARAGHATVMEKFTADSMVDGTLNVYRRLLENAPIHTQDTEQ